MNAIEILRRDHEKVKQLFAEFDSLTDGDNGRKQEIADQVFQELEMHSRIEEDIFYPAIKNKADKNGKKLVDHSYQEHTQVDQLISELRSLDAEDADFDDMFEELMEDVEHHIQQEESELFPRAQHLGAELDEIGKEIEEQKQSM
jgi:iron-sulfur cluster repair protein YtfE (RIC family)